MNKILTIITLALAGFTSTAFAAVDVAVSTALATAATDGATVAGLVLVAIVGIAAFKYMRRAL